MSLYTSSTPRIAVHSPLLFWLQVAFNPSSVSRICVRATNWIGDAVMSLPALRAIRGIFPHAHIVVLAKPWVGDLYARETCIDRVIPYTGTRREIAAGLRAARFDAA